MWSFIVSRNIGIGRCDIDVLSIARIRSHYCRLHVDRLSFVRFDVPLVEFLFVVAAKEYKSVNYPRSLTS